MPIQRLKKFNNFTAIPNATVTAIGQSDALAIWVYLMTKPDDWVIRRADIPAVFKIVVTVSFMQPEPVGWPTFPG